VIFGVFEFYAESLPICR